MEKVHFHQEQMLPELKDFVQKGIFIQPEIKQIIKKRTEFERTLIRRVARKADYLRYAHYEMGLEALRKKRAKRLNIPPSPHSISEYALVRRQFYIFERAVRKFKGDVDLWIQYIQLAKKEKARSLVGKISAKALQLHPTCATLYILASAHELDQLSPTAARALLQRGLRLNKENVRLWTEYAKMELGYVEGLRRRWQVLGIHLDADNSDKPPPSKETIGVEQTDIVIEDEETDSEALRDVMRGAIVRTVIQNAIQAVPKIEMFTSMKNMLSTYPTTLRPNLLDNLYMHLESTLPHDPQAVLFSATRSLSIVQDTNSNSSSEVSIVDALREANERLSDSLRSEEIDNVKMGKLYADWIEEWVDKLDEENLRLYLIQSLHSLIPTLLDQRLSPTLLAADLRLSISSRNPKPPSISKLMKTSHQYSSLFPESTDIWLARLLIADKNANPEVLERTWKEARKSAKGDDESLIKIWLYVVDAKDQTEDKMKLYQNILPDSMQHASTSLHPNLLIRYIADQYAAFPSVQQRHSTLSGIFKSYLPSPATYAHLFQCESRCSDPSLKNLESIFDRWRVSPGETVNAACQWASWLMKHGYGKNAKEVIERARFGDSAEKQELDTRWMEILQFQQEAEVHGEDEQLSEAEDADIEMMMN